METNSEVKEEKGLKAKTVSLIVKIVSVAFMVVCSVLKWTGKFKTENITIGEICAIGGVIGAVFGDISINTAIDKFVKNKGEKKNES